MTAAAKTVGVVATDAAPQAIGPYSQAIKAGPFLFCSGQIPLCKDGSLLSSDVAAETRQVLDNLSAVISAAGASLKHVVKTTIYVTDLANFATVNEVYGTFFSTPFPARATVQVAALPKGARVEIDATVYLPQ